MIYLLYVIIVLQYCLLMIQICLSEVMTSIICRIYWMLSSGNIWQWLITNKLSLNVKKTHYMVITKKRLPKNNIVIKINDHVIIEVHKTKLLGVIIDNTINWKDHVSYIAGKVSRGFGMMIKAKQYLQKEALLTLYYSFIYPYFTYCNHIWGATYVSNLSKLIRLQNAVIRIICNVKKLGSVTLLYRELGIFKLTDNNKYLIGRFMFRFCNGHVPVLFNSFFAYNYEFHHYNTRSAQHFHIPPVKTILGKTGIGYRGALIWNDYSAKVSIQILQNAYSLSFLKHLSRQYDDFMNHVNYFQYSLLQSIACLIWCIEKTGLSMHSTSVCYLVKKLITIATDLVPINLVRVCCPLCCINVNMSYRIQVFLNIHFCSCSSVSTELLVCLNCVCAFVVLLSEIDSYCVWLTCVYCILWNVLVQQYTILNWIELN